MIILDAGSLLATSTNLRLQPHKPQTLSKHGWSEIYCADDSLAEDLEKETLIGGGVLGISYCGETVYAYASKAYVARHEGSIPSNST